MVFSEHCVLIDYHFRRRVCSVPREIYKFVRNSCLYKLMTAEQLISILCKL